MAEQEIQGAEWSHDEPSPRAVQVALVGGSDHDRLRDVEVDLAVQRERINDHERVLTSIDKHLQDLVSRVDRFRTILLVGIAAVFGGSENGAEAIKQALTVIA